MTVSLVTTIRFDNNNSCYYVPPKVKQFKDYVSIYYIITVVVFIAIVVVHIAVFVVVFVVVVVNIRIFMTANSQGQVIKVIFSVALPFFLFTYDKSRVSVFPVFFFQ